MVGAGSRKPSSATGSDEVRVLVSHCYKSLMSFPRTVTTETEKFNDRQTLSDNKYFYNKRKHIFSKHQSNK
jgi:hypothetical protein